eukprot:TRINITY_DN32585_c0_g1_i1.p1 TRINITY_DN32585_c0_g1~~TRINITY_DN32585_c0_g1_i1.p1  ORF type:complete len:914 (+),score=118.85 TRINITY_DN32585_c0_g1_i1:396-3137(+)
MARRRLSTGETCAFTTSSDSTVSSIPLLSCETCKCRESVAGYGCCRFSSSGEAIRTIMSTTCHMEVDTRDASVTAVSSTCGSFSFPPRADETATCHATRSSIFGSPVMRVDSQESLFDLHECMAVCGALNSETNSDTERLRQVAGLLSQAATCRNEEEDDDDAVYMTAVPSSPCSIDTCPASPPYKTATPPSRRVKSLILPPLTLDNATCSSPSTPSCCTSALSYNCHDSRLDDSRDEDIRRESESGEVRPLKLWRRERLLGKGSFGRVNMAVNVTTGEKFAVKSAGGEECYSPSQNAAHIAALENEIEILSSLQCDQVVKFLGSDWTAESHGHVRNMQLEFMPGGSLVDLFQSRGKPLDEPLVQKYTRQITNGLAYLHSQGVVHGDIKGQNILIGRTGAKIADFGTAWRATATEAVSGEEVSSSREPRGVPPVSLPLTPAGSAESGHLALRTGLPMSGGVVLARQTDLAKHQGSVDLFDCKDSVDRADAVDPDTSMGSLATEAAGGGGTTASKLLGGVRGTVSWMSPEAVREEAQGTGVDIWSLGCCVLEMATGLPPWREVKGGLYAIMYAIACTSDLPQLPATLSSDARDFILRCLERDPSKRWTARDLLAHPFLASVPDTPISPNSTLFHGMECPESPTVSAADLSPIARKHAALLLHSPQKSKGRLGIRSPSSSKLVQVTRGGPRPQRPLGFDANSAEESGLSDGRSSSLPVTSSEPTLSSAMTFFSPLQDKRLSGGCLSKKRSFDRLESLSTFSGEATLSDTRPLADLRANGKPLRLHKLSRLSLPALAVATSKLADVCPENNRKQGKSCLVSQYSAVGHSSPSLANDGPSTDGSSGPAGNDGSASASDATATVPSPTEAAPSKRPAKKWKSIWDGMQSLKTACAKTEFEFPQVEWIVVRSPKQQAQK